VWRRRSSQTCRAAPYGATRAARNPPCGHPFGPTPWGSCDCGRTRRRARHSVRRRPIPASQQPTANPREEPHWA
jgi:hypothetical protein